MCLQCVVDAVSYGEVIPGFYLMRSVKGDAEWPAGQLGLVVCNDPTYYLEGLDEPATNPVFGMTDAEEEEALKDPEIEKQYDAFIAQIPLMCDALYGDAHNGHALVESCRSAGFDDKPYMLYEWLLHRIATTVKEIEPKHHGE